MSTLSINVQHINDTYSQLYYYIITGGKNRSVRTNTKKIIILCFSGYLDDNIILYILAGEFVCITANSFHLSYV